MNLCINNNYAIKYSSKDIYIYKKKNCFKKFELNAVGYVILMLINKGLPIEKIVEHIANQTGQPIELINDDVLFFIDSCIKKGFLIQSEKKSKLIGNFTKDIKLQNCQFEIINTCMFKCEHCFVDKTKQSIIDYNSVLKLLKELKKLGCNSISFTGGETLLYPNFDKLYIYAIEQGFIVSVNTNGFLIDEKWVSLFSKYKPYSLEISLYGYDEESYYKFTKQKDSFKNVNRAIDALINKKIYPKLKTVLTKNNIAHFEKIKKFAESKNLNFAWDFYVFPKDGVCSENEQKVDIKSLKNFFTKYDINKEYISARSENKLHLRNSQLVFQCGGGEEFIYVDSTGNINMCPNVRSNEVNISECSIKEALRFWKKFKKQKYNKNNKCYKCPNKAICRYCPGVFLAEMGDYQKASVWNCELANMVLSLKK